ncbi:MAG: hypothetical protein KF721_09755 [Ignavibacteriaceae bacterium]|nr:hypothetical protein [Ignavibacteriaceae bacterium]
MITPVELIGFFSQITNWLISIKNSVRVNREEYENILTLIYTAANETKHYIAQQKNGKPRDEEKEMRLSEMWMRAGVKVRRLDFDFGERLLLKADYWANPDSWTVKQINDAGIELDRVLKNAREIM